MMEELAIEYFSTSLPFPEDDTELKDRPEVENLINSKSSMKLEGQSLIGSYPITSPNYKSTIFKCLYCGLEKINTNNCLYVK